MKGRLIYFLFILPLSVCPIWIIDFFSGFLYLILRFVIRYRKNVIHTNLRNSFPGKSDAEINEIAGRFYRYLSTVFIDGIRSFSISKDELRENLKCENPEILRQHYDAGKSVIVTIGHYNSWELFLAGINLFIRHRAAVIYQPLTDPFLDKKLRVTRGEFRTLMVSVKDVKTFFRNELKEPVAIAFAIDQSPSKPDRCYWMNFLNQDTAVHFGAEKYAREYELPVYFAQIRRTGRKEYSLRFVPVAENPSSVPNGYITEQSTRLLEEEIRRQPEYWLWSHRRWKHKRPH